MKNRLLSVWRVIRGNWQMKLLSLIIAMVLWLLVVQYVNPDDVRRIDNIKINLEMEESVPAGEGLALVTAFNESLTLTYKASRDVIAVLNTDKISAYVDLSNATKSGEFSYPVKIDTGGQNITIVDQSVKEVVLKFEKSITAQVKVRISASGNVAEGFIKNDPVCVPSAINIEGPESKVNSIVAAEAVINEKQFTETKVYNCDYVFVDVEGNTVSKDFIQADYDKVDVSVSVLKTKTLPVTATLVNTSGGNEKSFASLSFYPETITVAGGEEILETLNSYDLGTIDVADQPDNFEQTFAISLPNGIKNIDDVTEVKLAVSFGDVMMKTVKFTDFTVINEGSGQSAVVTDKSLNVTFRGIAADIAKIDVSSIRLIVDLQNKEQTKGKNSFPVYADIPEGLQVGVVGKYTVTVEVK